MTSKPKSKHHKTKPIPAPHLPRTHLEQLADVLRALWQDIIDYFKSL
jgi:hypothetical protein